MSLRKYIMSHPTFLGVLIAFLLAGGIFAMEIWFPWVGDEWARHERLVQAIYFTAFFFGAWIYFLWEWRHRRAFWASVSLFFLLHVLGVLFYTTQVRPILVWQWSIVLFLESFVLVFFVHYSTRRFKHLDRHRGGLYESENQENNAPRSR
jgi:hypothetical protein